MALDDAHHRRFPDDGEARFRVAITQDVAEVARTEAADLFVMGEGEMHRAAQLLAGKMRGHRHGGGDEALHVAGAAPEEMAVAFDHPVGVAGPVLVFDRNDIGMARQHDAAGFIGTDPGQQVGLGPGVVG